MNNVKLHLDSFLPLRSRRYYASPRTQIQKTQNVALVFRFLTEVEKLQLGDSGK